MHYDFSPQKIERSRIAATWAWPLAASACLLTGCPFPDDSDIIEKTIRPAPFFLSPADATSEIQISVCTNGRRSDFYDDPPVFRVTLLAIVSASPPAQISMRLDSQGDTSESEGASEQDVEAREATEVELEANFPADEQTTDELCSRWGTYVTTRLAPEDSSHIRVEWRLSASTDSINRPSVDIYIR